VDAEHQKPKATITQYYVAHNNYAKQTFFLKGFDFCGFFFGFCGKQEL